MKPDSHNEKQTQNDTEEQKPFLSVLVHSFFVIPFLILVFSLLLFVSMHLLTQENRTAFDYLEDVKTGGLTKRWQGAFELSKILSNPNMIPDDTRFHDELIGAYIDSKSDDPRVRQYLALAMGRIGNSQFYETLTEGINQETNETLSAVLYALGMLKDKRATKDITPFLQNENSRVRSIAVVALGNLRDPKANKKIQTMLNDSEPNVQWGAAISLANMGDDEGEAILLKLLNRQYYTQFSEVDSKEQINLMLMVIDASQYIKSQKIADQIQYLADNDQNLKVRTAAQQYSRVNK